MDVGHFGKRLELLGLKKMLPLVIDHAELGDP